MSHEVWSGKRVLVTGANGFIGRSLTQTLIERGAEVVILVRDEHPQAFRLFAETHSKLAAVVRGDVLDLPLLTRIFNSYGVEVAFHLAAQAIVPISNRSPLMTLEPNIRGTWNVLEAARNAARIEALVVASSDKAYGEPTELPITEDHPLLASNPYDVSKACADLLSRAYGKTYGLPLSVTRCSNVYGGGDLNFSRIVPSTIRALVLGQRPAIRSDGRPVRDYMYISDAVSAYMRLAENSARSDIRCRAFNFGTEKPTAVVDVVRALIAISGRELEPVIENTASNEIVAQYVSCKAARELLGWQARIPLKDGLIRTFEWYSANRWVFS